MLAAYFDYDYLTFTSSKCTGQVEDALIPSCNKRV
jgi:hypothetical protein